MKKLLCTAVLLSLLLPAGCAAPEAPSAEKWPSIPFQEGQLYAAAHLGYLEMEDLDHYTETYLDGAQLPVHYLSGGDFYLIIPRYEGMSLRLYRNDIETMDSCLFYEDPDCAPFIVQCNVSDIFPDLTVRLAWEGESVEFSPYISLEDGGVRIGERGLDLTKAS